MALLELQDVHTYYGKIHALKGISIKIEKGEIVTLIGSNGAGKSTTLRTISGLLTPRQGRVLLNGQPIHQIPPHEIVKLGVAQSPEGRRIFPRLTVLENLEMGAYLHDTRSEAYHNDLERVLTTDDLVRSNNVFFAATGITRGELLDGVQYFGGGARTSSIVMRSKSGTIRRVNATHRLDKLMQFSVIKFD